MKILFIANPHLNLYKDIEQEFRNQGHEVTLILDRLLRFDPYCKTANFNKLKELLFVKIYDLYVVYWKRQIREDKRLSEFYDCLFVLSGMSVGEYLIKYLEGINPHLRKVLYTWDSCRYYNYARHLPLFDKCYNFDILDVERDSRWTLMSIYYKMSEQEVGTIPVYDLFCVGTNHDERYGLFKKIMPQIQRCELKYYIKLVEPNQKISSKQMLKYYIVRQLFSKYYSSFIDQVHLILEDDVWNLKRTDLMANDEYMYYSHASRCILDTQREGQSGLTARFIWALANGKKIITTNKWANHYPFVNPHQVFIVDRMNIQIPIEFIKSPLNTSDIVDISFLRIDNWVHKLLSLD